MLERVTLSKAMGAVKASVIRGLTLQPSSPFKRPISSQEDGASKQLTSERRTRRPVSWPGSAWVSRSVGNSILTSAAPDHFGAGAGGSGAGPSGPCGDTGARRGCGRRAAAW